MASASLLMQRSFSDSLFFCGPAEVVDQCIAWKSLFCLGKGYSIVAFPDEDYSTAIEHKAWLKDDGNVTFLPSEKCPNRLRRLVTEGMTPRENWTEAECEIKSWGELMIRLQKSSIT